MRRLLRRLFVVVAFLSFVSGSCQGCSLCSQCCDARLDSRASCDACTARWNCTAPSRLRARRLLSVNGTANSTGGGNTTLPEGPGRRSIFAALENNPLARLCAVAAAGMIPLSLLVAIAAQFFKLTVSQRAARAMVIIDNLFFWPAMFILPVASGWGETSCSFGVRWEAHVVFAMGLTFHVRSVRHSVAVLRLS
jgi:hypothetical protein